MEKQYIQVQCMARYHKGRWEALCLDLDLATQGESLEEVRQTLSEMIRSYSEAVSELPTEDQKRLALRPAPFWLRLRLMISYAIYTLCTGRRGRNGDSFVALTCPA